MSEAAQSAGGYHLPPNHWGLLGCSFRVNDIAQLIHLSQFNVSNYRRVLREAEIVEMEPCTLRFAAILPQFYTGAQIELKLANDS